MLSALAPIGYAPPAKGSNWAVLIAGSAGYGNYRHHADVCHAYQIMIDGGIPAKNIIVLADDNVANDPGNPFPGKLFNKPTFNKSGVDVYDGCVLDYRGADVTPDTFVSVLTGDASALQGVGTGRVLASGAKDKVFVNFVDHGGPDIIGFPHTTMHSAELIGALKTMHTKSMYAELVFYLEACESGSMFKNLPADMGIFATTAANATQSSWGTYCPGYGSAATADVVDGVELHTCLGDLYSVNWMEDSDAKLGKGETLAQQYALVAKETNKSHVLEFGDLTIAAEPVANFQGGASKAAALPAALPTAPTAAPTAADKALREASAIRATDASMVSAFARFMGGDAAAGDELRREMDERADAQAKFAAIRATAAAALAAQAAAGVGATAAAAAAATPSQLQRCHFEGYAAFAAHCGAWTPSALPHASVLSELCEASRGDPTAEVVRAIRATCAAPAAATAATATVEAAGAAQVAPGQVALDKAPYHVGYAVATASKLFPAKDVHLLSGTVTQAAGGRVRVECVNKTLLPYTMDVGAAWAPPHYPTTEMYFNFTAAVGASAAHLTAISGKLLAVKEGEGAAAQLAFREVYFFDPKEPTGAGMPYAILLDGPNPRPPPPPPPRCVDAYNATGCAAIPKPSPSSDGCTWCASKDGVHALCFADKHTPDASAWKCGA